MLQEARLPVTVCVTPSRYLGEDVFETIRAAYELFPNVKVNPNLFRPKEETGRAGQADDPDTELYIRIYQYLASLKGQILQPIEEDQLPEPGCPVEKANNNRESGKTGEQCVGCKDSSSAHSRDDKPCGMLCGAGRSIFSIDWKGQMIPCSLLEMIKEDPIKMGFQTAWKRVNQAAIRWPRPAECEVCPYRDVCNRCALNMVQLAEPGVRPTALCRRTRLFASAGIYRMPDCK